MFKYTLPRLWLVSAKGLRQDALGGRPAECEDALSIRVTCLAHQYASHDCVPKKRSATLADRLKGIVAETSLIGLNENTEQ